MKSARIAVIIWISSAVLLLCAGCWAQGPADNRPIDIGLAPAQKAQLKTLAARVKQRARNQRAALRRARANLVRLYSNYSLDEQNAKSAEAAVGKAQLNLLNMHFENQVALRKILDKDQFSRFTKVIKSRMRHRPGTREEEAESLADRLTNPSLTANINATPDQSRRLRTMPGKQKVFDKLKQDIARMVALYGNYNLDVAAAKKQIGIVHQDQMQTRGADFAKAENSSVGGHSPAVR